MNTMRIFFALILIAGVWACNDNQKAPTKGASANPKDTTDKTEAVTSEPQDTTPPLAFEGIEWTLFTMVKDGKNEKILNDAVITAKFKNGRVSGLGGCNQFSSEYEATEEGALQIKEIGATKRFCNGLMGQEGNFFAALASVTSWKSDLFVLTLETASGTLIFRDLSVQTENGEKKAAKKDKPNKSNK